MGRGPSWSSGDAGVLEAYIDQGKGPAFVAQQHPDWSLSSIKKAMAKLRKGVSLNKYQGRAKTFNAEQSAFLKSLAEEEKSLKEIQEAMEEKFGIKVTKATVSRYLKTDHGMQCVKKVRTFHIRGPNHALRKTFAEQLLQRMKPGPCRLRMKSPPPIDLANIIFSDEKIYRQEPFVATQHKRKGLSKETTKAEELKRGSKSLRLTHEQRSPGVMVSLAVSLVSRILPPAFIPPNTKIDAKEYISVLENHYLPKLVAYHGLVTDGYWQEDNAPSHRARLVHEWKNKHWPFSEFRWPPNSPDLNVLDYAVWSLIEGRIKPCRNIPELKIQIKDAVAYFNTDGWPVVERAILEFPKRLQALADVGGGHFEG